MHGKIYTKDREQEQLYNSQAMIIYICDMNDYEGNSYTNFKTTTDPSMVIKLLLHNTAEKSFEKITSIKLLILADGTKTSTSLAGQYLNIHLSIWR